MILLAAGCFNASAQEVKTEEVFNPHWYVQGQFGFQHTLGEISDCDLNSLNAQIAVGYNFTKVWGARLTIGGWQSKGGIHFEGKPKYRWDSADYGYKWNYVAPTLNATFNVTNAIGGFNPKRIVDFTLFAGVGANIGWANGEAATAQGLAANHIAGYTTAENMAEVKEISKLEYLWDGSQILPVGQFGAALDFKVSKRVSVGIEANINFLSDKYNSKKSTNVDWYFNTLAGVKIALGKTTKKVPAKQPEVVYVDKIVEVPVHDTIRIEAKKPAKEPIRRDIFFTICKSDVSSAEMPKVEDIASYLNRYPEATVSITGYADKGTGNAKGNIKYARNRAEMVAKILKEKFGISSSRIKVDSKGDTVQPYDINDLNRVSICIAE